MKPEQILTQAKNGGLDLRIHIDEFKDCGGGELAADLKVRSADHAHYTSENGRQAMDSAGVNTGFLPGTPYSMGEQWPNFNEMVDKTINFHLEVISIRIVEPYHFHLWVPLQYKGVV